MHEDSTYDQPDDTDEIRIGTEDLVDAHEFVITEEDMVEGDMRALFERPGMRQFIEFVEAGLPDVYLRSNPELAEEGNRKRIAKVIAKVPDQTLKMYLEQRLKAIDGYAEELDGTG